ncbi:peptidyl-dipeptidase Dcp [Arachidicoccus rhizosphaerae]|uniref:Dipeptidyl carboxypeptidase n=1 Tax=Arachidicoccus rhizosphaerae TaxID=551991 RepID=A0A1H4A3G8_9BACT|nr:peptidyl-dipeptidase Dcp [Arachidicoccus rhizosphaerae]SEA30410.1 peptidyl-dipeptidase Dcp [Arachidicoccus rhizosphaerae]
MKTIKMLSLLPVAAAIVLSSSCGNNKQQTKNNNKVDTLASDNPFLKTSTLPYEAPDFTKIKDEDFKPAIIEGMRLQLDEIKKITDNPDSATFLNTLVPLEQSGSVLKRAAAVFNLLTGANTNEYLQKVQEELAPLQAAHSDAIHLNKALFDRITTVYNHLDKSNLDSESKRLVAYYYQEFMLAGAKLSDQNKILLKQYNEQEASLSAKFTNQLLAAAKAGAYIANSKEELAGLSEGALEAAAEDAKTANLSGKWLLPLQNTTQQPALGSLTNRTTREKLFELSWNRAEKNDSNDTRKTIKAIAQIRAQKAALMGYANYAAWKLQDQMAKTPEAVDKFFADLVPAAVKKARQEASDIQAVIDSSHAGFQLAPYDWDYYADKVRKARYNLDENEIKPYFELNKVLEDGVFYAATQLYGITFKERKDIPVYQKDVRVFEVFDQDKTSIGLFYFDYFKRDNKSGGAWMDNLVTQSKLLGTKPVIYNVCNFTKPAPGQPALISFDDVTTMFHEFGHALHGFFASQQYPSLSGTNVARDFVEFPSQFNEHWALDPAILKHYAIHYKTGQPISVELVDKIKKASTFNQGYMLTELLAAAALDMKWHKLKPEDPIKDVDSFELHALEQTGLYLNTVPPRYRSSYFLHIWSNGYAAGYYAYLWTEMLDDDAFEWFKEHGGLSRANGQRFRDMILSKGNTEDLEKIYEDFRGQKPSIKPMEENRGLLN